MCLRQPHVKRTVHIKEIMDLNTTTVNIKLRTYFLLLII